MRYSATITVSAEGAGACVGIQSFMNDLFVLDWFSTVLKGHYSADKMIETVTGLTAYDHLDLFSTNNAAFHVAGFSATVPLGSKIHVSLSRSMGLGTDFDATLVLPITADYPAYDLEGNVVDKSTPIIQLSTAVTEANYASFKGSYEVELRYNGQVKTFKIIVE